MYNIIQYLENNCLKMINIEDDINWEDLYVIYENEYESKMDNFEPIDNQNDINQIPNEISDDGVFFMVNKAMVLKPWMQNKYSKDSINFET